ncbi:MFS transporter [Paenibacillus sp. GCM10027627]|uniref:MFS transporter n=1 Tax=unclassified Paenibacillus TaxID=185978 RepID=UPI0036432372
MEDRRLSIAKQNRIVLLFCCMAPFAIMNSYMLNLALPEMAAYFGVNTSTAGWLITMSGIISALGAPIYGKLADIYGVKKLAIFGVILFSAGSAICMVSPSFPLLMVGRVIQGIGVSSIPSLAMLVPVFYVDAERRGKALGTMASTMALAGAVGPVVGGVITGYLHWRFMFLFSVLVLVMLPLIMRWLPDQGAKKSEKMDFPGAGLLAASVTGLMLSVTLLNPLLLIGSLIGFVIFVIREKKAKNPFVPLPLFRSSSYRFGLLVGGLNTVMNFGVFLITPLLLSKAYGLEGQWIGLLMAPGAVVAAVLGKYGGKLADRKGNHYVLRIAAILLGIGFLSLSTLAGYAYWGVSLSLILTQAGYILMQPATANWVSASLDREHAGIGMGVYSLSNFLSIALSGAAMTKLVEFDALPLVNPIAGSMDQSSIYSNLYLLFFVLALFNLYFAYKMKRKRAGKEGSIEMKKTATQSNT